MSVKKATAAEMIEALSIQTPSVFDAAPWETLDRVNFLTTLGAATAFGAIAAEMRALCGDRRYTAEKQDAMRAAYALLSQRLQKTPLFARVVETMRQEMEEV